ncbi:MAG: carboxylating nicotinate-nucleotide diphosphorylase [Nanoarchaeota archaeon]
MEKERQRLAREFWDRSNKLNIANKDYSYYVKSLINEKLIEDYANNDLTTISLIKSNKKIKAAVVAKQDGIIAGIDEALLFDLSIKKLKNDGNGIKKTDKILEIHDDAKKILSYERTLLNILQRMSGIATMAYNLSSKIKNDCFIAGTRKTLFPLLDKKALSVGGALTHRLNLNDSILIKENHLQLLNNNIKKALNLANENNKPKYVEIEVKNEKEALEAAEAIFCLKSNKLFAIMFDNMKPIQIKNSIKKINNNHKKNTNQKMMLFEASGGINEKNISEYSKTGVDVISLGALTHSARAFDLSLEVL